MNWLLGEEITNRKDNLFIEDIIVIWKKGGGNGYGAKWVCINNAMKEIC